MNTNDLDTALFEKMTAEQDKFRGLAEKPVPGRSLKPCL